MNEFEKLYTVDDIAQMTMLTSRTIRNYLRDGLLVGRKIGGQWRFTEKDVVNLFHNSTVNEDIKSNRRQEIMDFINGVDTDTEGELQICTIADYYCPDINITKELSLKLCEVISTQSVSVKLRFHYDYIEKEQKARYTFFGTPGFIKDAVTILDDEWNKLNNSQMKFTDKADNYEKYRPSYPQKVLDLIQSIINKVNGAVADIGSGTGKMTELLLDRGYVVYAVEPNDNMRKIADSKLISNKNFHSLLKTAENTSLEADSLDAIVCAESFHWFDNDKTKLEFKRILKTNGYVFLIWNTPGRNVYDSEMGALFDQYCDCDKSDIIRISKEERAEHLFGKGNYQMVEFENVINEPFEGLLGGSLSSAFAPKPGDEFYDSYVNGIKNIFNQYSKDGIIEAKFITRCYYGKL